MAENASTHLISVDENGEGPGREVAGGDMKNARPAPYGTQGRARFERAPGWGVIKALAL